MKDEQQIIDDICAEFENVQISILETIDDVIAVARQYQDIIESHELITTHHVIESIEEPTDDSTISIVSPLIWADGEDTELAFVFHYTKTDENYEVFADVDFYASVDIELDLDDDDGEE